MQEASPVKRASARFSFDKATLTALSATAVLTLFVFTTSPAISFLGTKTLVLMMGTLIALALYIVARLTRGNVILPPTMLLGALWLVPLAYALSALFSGANAGMAFFGTEFESATLGFMIALSAIATLFALAFRREAEYGLFYKVAGYAFGVLAVVQVILVIAARMAPNAIAPLSNLVGSFSDMGMLAGLGVVTALLALRFLELSGRSRILLWVGIALGFFLLALVNSFTLWLLVTLVSLGLLIESLMRRMKASGAEPDLEGVATMPLTVEEAPGEPRPVGPALVALVVSLFFLISGSTIGNAFSSAFGASFIDVRPSWQSTFGVGGHTYASSPLFGSGPGTFGEEWVKHRDRALNDTIFWNVDFASGIGYVPTAMVTTGVLGTLAWLAFLGLFLYAAARTLLMRLPQSPAMRFVAMASFVGAAYVLALAIVATPGPVVLAAGFVLLGLAASSTRHGRDKMEWGVIFSRNPRAGFAVVFILTILLIGTVFAAYVVVERYLAGLAYGESATALARGDLPGAEAAAIRSLAFAEQDRTYRLAAAISVARMGEIAASTTLAPTDAQQQFQAALSASIQAAARATELSPDNYQNWLALGGVFQSVVPLQIEGAAAQAVAAYERAGALAPTNPGIPYTLAQLAIAGGDYPAAETRLLEAIALKRDYTQAILLLSQLQVQLGKAAEALQAVEAAIYFSPNDPATLFQAGVLRLGTGDEAGAIQALSRAVELNDRYANARFFLAVAQASSGQLEQAAAQLTAVAALSEENVQAVASDLAALKEGKNPYPASRLRTLGVPSAPVQEPEPDPADAE